MTNTSFDTSYLNICGTFAERGLIGSVKTSVAEQQRRELRTRLENPGAYVFDDIMQSSNSDKYRTGNEDGLNYMTVDDLLRLYEDEDTRRRDFRRCSLSMMTNEGAESKMRYDRRPAHAYGVSTALPLDVNPSKSMKHSAVYDGNYELEMAVTPANKGFLQRAVDWSKQLIENVTEIPEKKIKRKTKAAIVSVSLCLVFTLVLALPIALSVMINNESIELGTLKDTLRSKAEEVEALEIELDRKNDRFILEDLAVNKYGMIELNLSAYKVMTVNAEDSVEVIDEEKQNTGGAVLALLSALGLRKSAD